MNSHQRRKARRRARVWLDVADRVLAELPFDLSHYPLFTYDVDSEPRDGELIVKPWIIPSALALAVCMACGTGIEGEDAGTPIEDAGQVDAGYDAGEEPTEDAGPLDACEERQAQWCQQGCIGTIGIDRECPELDCEC